MTHKEGAEKVLNDFKKFDDKDLHLLKKIAEVYFARIKSEQNKNNEVAD